MRGSGVEGDSGVGAEWSTVRQESTDNNPNSCHCSGYQSLECMVWGRGTKLVVAVVVVEG